ncbi:hypothetical protein [Nisaea sediminum]|uniref:hypothetical protein n=1 Tax=Nisaea sediminum TaxID=2775867 RepID=UPI0018696B14|nr:hypothetical protein [Nisaea sediminum]
MNFPRLMPDEKLSIQMIILSSGVVFLVALVFEALVPRLSSEISATTPNNPLNNSPIFNIIIYIISSSMHISLSIFFSFHLYRDLKKISPPPRFKIKINIIAFSFFFISVAIVCAIFMESNIVIYSHDRTLSIFLNTKWDYFLKCMIPFTDFSIFSLYPIFLILCGVLFSVVACVWSSVKSIDIVDNQLNQQDFDRNIIWSEISLFSIIVSAVFLTSSVATIFYLNLGSNIAGADEQGVFYRASADGLSFLWSVCFSIIMVIIVLFPTGHMNAAARKRKKESRVLGKDMDRFDFIHSALSTDRVVKMIVVLFSPVYVAAIRVAIG